MSVGMNLFSARPRSPFLHAYLSLLPGCALGGLGLLAYALMTGPGAVDIAKFLVALVLVFVWCGYSFAVGVVLVTVYVLPLAWLLLRAGIAGPVPMFLVGVAPGIALDLASAEYRPFAL